MADQHATERIIGGLILVGIASLLSWNHAQNGDTGTLGIVLTGVIVLGGLWAALGLAELIFGPLRDSRLDRPHTPDGPS